MNHTTKAKGTDSIGRDDDEGFCYGEKIVDHGIKIGSTGWG